MTDSLPLPLPLRLDPFTRLVALTPGWPGQTLVVDHQPEAAGLNRAVAHVFDAAGRRLAVLPGVADLLPGTTGDGIGGLLGLRLSADGLGMTVFAQSLGDPLPTPIIDSAVLAPATSARLIPWPDGRLLVAGHVGSVAVLRIGPLAAGADLSPLPVTGMVEDPATGLVIGQLVPEAGIAALDGCLCLGSLCTLVDPGSGGIASPLGQQSNDLWQTPRLIDAGETLAGAGPVTWRTTGVCAWNGRFWIAATASTAEQVSHRLYRLFPGGVAERVAETGGAVLQGGALVPWGHMIRGPLMSGGGVTPGGRGGLWPGDRLILAAWPSQVAGPAGPVVAPGPPGVLVIDPVPTGEAPQPPLFRPLPGGVGLAAAHCLGPLALAPGEGSGPVNRAIAPPAPWLCHLCHEDHPGIAAVTRDFVAITPDPWGEAPPPGTVASRSRWGLWPLATPLPSPRPPPS